jgi:hypothetical protein
MDRPLLTPFNGNLVLFKNDSDVKFTQKVILLLSF